MIPAHRWLDRLLLSPSRQAAPARVFFLSVVAIAASLSPGARAFVRPHPLPTARRALACMSSGQGSGQGMVQLFRGAFDGSTASAKQDMRSQGSRHQMTWSDGAGAMYSPHQHGHNEVIYMVEGGMVFTEVSTGKDFAMQKGDKLILPQGTVHSAATETGCTYIIANS